MNHTRCRGRRQPAGLGDGGWLHLRHQRRTGHRERASGPCRHNTANHTLGFAETAPKILLNISIAVGDAVQQHHDVSASEATTSSEVVAEASLVAVAGLKEIRAHRKSA